MTDDLSNGGLWLFAILALMWGGGGFGFGNNGLANAIGYENLATSNEVQRGFDNQNAMANQREILSAVTSGTAQNIAAVQDKYFEISRDIGGVSGQIAQLLANQNQCCCDTKMLIQETAAQNRYDSAMNTQKILDVLAENKIEALQGRINQLELQQAVSGVIRYPNLSYTLFATVKDTPITKQITITNWKSPLKLFP